MAEAADDNQKDIIKEAVRQFADARLRGEHTEIDEFVKQYPGLEHQIGEGIKNLQKIDALFDTLVQADESDFDIAATGPNLIGQKVGNFEIVEMIGRGGMGVVYQAHDTKLKRSVAIKSMPAALTDDSTAQMRFRREAELLASLNHPNIAVIHEIIDQEDAPGYLVLEYVPGETLSDRLKREPFKLEEALSVARQVAEAISAAHEKGIIHRDLKPSNIKLTPDGRVKVLDFGLAKSSVSEGKDIEITCTKPGHIIGTPAYMSPEQARGKSTDHRTDIWSFGCIMYQMLTGHLPFEGETATDTLARIIECQPDWELLPNETPENIRVLLRQCMEKNQDERLGDIGDASIEISETLSSPTTTTATLVRIRWHWAIAIGFVMVAIVVGLNIGRWREQLLGGPGRVESIAVLPLQNLTGDPNQEYFADGMTDSLIASLGKIGALQVRSRTSIMQYKGARKPLPEIARELNVDAVVEGSVMRIGNKVRITAQLIHAPTDTHIWVDSYERDLSDVLTLLSRVARTIASQIEITVTPDQETRLAVNRPINPETYDAYCKGMFFLNKATPEGTKKGLDYLHQAIKKDPADPLAYGGLALCYAVSAHGPGAPPDALKLAKAAALKALELDDMQTEAHAALAQIKLYEDWDWKGAEQAFQHALKLNSTLTTTRAQYSWYLFLFGRLDEAEAEMRRVQATDPLTPLWPAWQGWQYYWMERYEEAIVEARKSLELNHDFPVGLYVLGSAYTQKGMYEEAIEAHQRAGTISRKWKFGLGRTYALADRQDDARLVLDELEADSTTWDTFFIAQIYAFLGQKDEAFRWLEIAYGPPNHPYVPWIRYPPAFKSLQDDPRFDDLLRRMNLPE
jgi:serine/threonine protein kinase/tetratricopeptide (TPR) repeat protein